MRSTTLLLAAALCFLFASAIRRAIAADCCAAIYDLVIRGGTIFDGGGGEPFVGDVGIKGDRIVAVGPNLSGTSAARTIDATGLAVAPGFINMLSWADESLIEDGAGESDIRQGVTLEVFGEGWSNGPLNERDGGERDQAAGRHQIPDPVADVGRLFRLLTRRGIAPNVASFVGDGPRSAIHVLGEGDVDPTPAQLGQMQNLVRAAMNEGAMGRRQLADLCPRLLTPKHTS